MSAPSLQAERSGGLVTRFDLDAALVVAGCLALTLLGSLINPAFLTANYLLQQAQIATFVGVIATGAMFVILIGEIDLSVPWTLTSTAILTTSLAGSDSGIAQALAVPAGILAGLAIGTLNGLGVALFRIPSMVWTLAINAMLLGATVFYTGGFKPRGAAPELSITLALGRSFGLPNALLTWLLVAGLALWMLKCTTYGTYLYAMGNSQKALFLSGVRVRRVTVATFALAGGLSSFGGLLVTGYANQAYQGMGDAYLLPAITAVVIGGVSIQGGKGSYLGVFAGAFFITLLTSILSVLQMSEASRQVILGAIIMGMMLFHRSKARI